MANDVVKRLMARIRELREARGFTQESFAEHADLKYKHYQSVEAGRKPNLQLFTLVKIAKGLGVDLKDLVDFETSPLAVAENSETAKAKPSAHKSRKVVVYRQRTRKPPKSG